MKILILIVATCVVGALCEERCEPGTTFMEDCNKCRCGVDGQKACTRKMCPPKEQSDDSQVRTDVQNGDALSAVDEKEEVLQSNGQVCSPNEIKMKDCNRCRCANNGIGWFCTRRACPQREKRSTPDSEEKCTPGTQFLSKDGCNTCYCSESGEAACTLMLCIRKGQKVKRSVPGPNEKCTPGTTFRSDDDCNTCFCTELGTVACTRKACLPADSFDQKPKQKRAAPSAEEKCTPGTSFPSKDGCNTCFCTETGIAACTLKGCLPPGFFDQKLKQKRAAPSAEEKCTPGTSFPSKDGCNTCFCTETGIAACTLKACLPPGFFDQQQKQKPKEEAPVDDLPQSAIAPGAPGFSCTPKTSFKYQCNTCLCSDDGKTAGCSFKFCIPGEW